MRRKTLSLIATVAFVAAACGGPGIQARRGPAEDVFVPHVVAFEGQVGAGLSLSVDADGNPHLAYLAFEDRAGQGQTPAQADPTGPTLPAVMHAHLMERIWTRSVVAEDQPRLDAAGDEAAIAVDQEGVHHVLWTAGGALFSSSNAGGEFSEPERIASDVVGGVAAAAGGGRVSASFVQDVAGPEGPGSLVRVATLQGEAWAVETAAEAGAEPAAATAIGLSGDTTLVAYGDEGGTFLVRSGPPWQSELVDPNGRGRVSMSVDGDGNPHLAYTSADGEVKHAHSIGGSPWEISTVAPSGGTGATAIAVDPEGVHHVAWETDDGIAYASNREGQFAEEEVLGSGGGVRPALGAGAGDAVYLAWHDPQGGQLILAIRSEEEPLLAVPSPSPQAGGPTGPPTGPPPCEPDGTALQITAPPGAAADGFASDCLAVPAGEDLTIEFLNDDPNVPHNVGVYASQGGEAFFQGEIITGPDRVTYDPDPVDEPGQYWFQCDVHPTTMTGTFVVE